MKRAAVIVKLKGDNLADTVSKVIDILERNDIIPMLEKETIKRLNFNMPFSTIQEMRAKADFAVVLGGDGTLLYTSRVFRLINIPILAFNLGRVGFIMELDLDDVERFILDAINNRLTIKRRMKLSSEIYEDGKLIFEEEALNEIAISKGTPSRMLELTVSIDTLPVLRYRSDGLIISTPTGSTGYTISAGGPIVHPDLDNIILSPICPHTLNIRPIVIPHSSDITVKIESSYPVEAYITYDGQIVREFTNSHQLIVRKSPVYAYIAVKQDSNYYLTLRKKLGWGGEIC